MYKVYRSKLDGKLKLKKLGVEVPYFTKDVFADFSLILKDKRYNTNYTNLEDLLRDLNKVTSFKDSQLFISDRGSRNKVELGDLIEEDKPFIKSTYSISYELELIPQNYGFSSYNFLTYFMPKWSTAFKFTHSNHSKLIEPIFTNLLHTKEYIKHLVNEGNDPFVSDEYFLFSRKAFSFEPPEIISSHTTGSYITRNYLVGSEALIDFGVRNTKLIIRASNYTVPVELLITGMYKNTLVSEVVKLTSEGLYELKLNYSKIFNIEFMSFNLDLISLEDTFLEVSNSLFFKEGDFKYFQRGNGEYFELDGKKIILRSSQDKVLEVFSLPFNTFKYILIDTKDNILINRSNTIYSGKMDALLDLQIPEDMTYNNTRFIETTFLTASEYSVDLLLKDYISSIEKDLISICIKDSNQACYYINRELELVETTEEIFIGSGDLVKDILSFEIGMSLTTEYLTITLNDYEGHNKKSNVIIHPTITAEREFSLDLNEELVYLDGDYSLVNLDNSTLKTPTRKSEFKIKTAADYKYYYLTSDMYNTESSDNSSYTALMDFSVEMIQSRMTQSFLESTSSNTAQFLSLDLDLVRKYTTNSLPVESVASRATASFTDSSLTKFISYTSLNYNLLGKATDESKGFIEAVATTSTARFNSFFIEEFPFLYKSAEITQTTSTVPSVEFEIKRV